MKTIVTIVLFLKLTRPLFLLGGVLLYLLGTYSATVAGSRPINVQALITGQLLVTSIQLMTHYANEYFDLESDRQNDRRTWFSGGSGVLVEGSLPPSAALNAAKIAALLSIGLLILAGAQVMAVFWLGLLALLAAWSYSGPPFFLVRTGWGEISASLVVAGTVPLVGYLMQSGGQLSLFPLLVCIPLVLIHFAMLVAFEIPDRSADQAVGKRTLAVRFGLATAAHLHNGSLFLAFGLLFGLWAARWPGAQLAWLACPLALWQAVAIHRFRSAQTPLRYFWLTTGALGLFATTTFLWLAGLIFQWVAIG